MKKLLFAPAALFMLLFISLSAGAQDMLVTPQGDTLNCKIVKIKKDYISYKFLKDGMVRGAMVPAQKVIYYRLNAYPKTELPADVLIAASRSFPRVNIGVNGGFSYLTATTDGIPSALKPHYKNLKTGYHLGADAVLFLSDRYGIGIHYSYFRSTVQSDVMISIQGQGTFPAMLRDDITVHFIGPSFTERIISRNGKNQFTGTTSIGYATYRNNAALMVDIPHRSSTVGFHIGLGMDFGVSENTKLGINAGMTAGWLSYYYFEDLDRKITLEKGDYESITRIDVSVAFKWCK